MLGLNSRTSSPAATALGRETGAGEHHRAANFQVPGRWRQGGQGRPLAGIQPGKLNIAQPARQHLAQPAQRRPVRLAGQRHQRKLEAERPQELAVRLPISRPCGAWTGTGSGRWAARPGRAQAIPWPGADHRQPAARPRHRGPALLRPRLQLQLAIHMPAGV